MSKDFITLSRAAFGDDDDGSDYDHDGDDGAESVKRCLSDDSGVHDTYKQMVIGDDIYIMVKCLSVTKNQHFLLGVSCNHMNPP